MLIILKKGWKNLENKIKIIVDVREMRTSVVKELYELGAEIETAALPVGDFILSEKVCIEKKTRSDFLQSIVDGRIFEQVKNMSECFDKPAIILEGIEDIYCERNMHPNAIRGAISSLSINYRIPIIQSSCEKETAMFLYMIAKREQIEKERLVNLRGEKKPLSRKEIKEYIVSSFPGIGRKTAQNLLKHFQTVKAFINAEEDELKKVKNIGKKTIKNIQKILEEKYEK